MKAQLTLFVAALTMIACSSEPPVSDLKKDRAIEVTYKTEHLGDSSVLLIRKENVYLKGQLVKSFSRTDTLPAPGDTTQTVEDANDNTQSIKTPKEYEFFVTVK